MTGWSATGAPMGTGKRIGMALRVTDAPRTAPVRTALPARAGEGGGYVR
ncbi:hypothetical protein HMPREF1550_01198 [Actinomyces sp. oral taxon 877 str. F0543]|nr:hypothetical protein HMPREF1550_01198 [Actinomyces sp. oral taxon 877 str. F0543]